MDIEQQVEEYNRKVYDGDMPIEAKQTYRSMLRRELREDEKWGEISNRDYLDADHGEAPKGAEW